MSDIQKVTVPSRLARVTVLEDRAMVRRTAIVAGAAGQLRAIVEGVSPILVDKSLRVRSAGTSVRVLDARCLRTLAPWRAGQTAPSDAALEATRAASAARQEVDRARAEVTALTEELAAHSKLRRAEWAALSLAAARGLALGEAAAVIDAGDVQLAELGARILDAQEHLASCEEALADADQLAALAQQRTGDDAARLEIDCVVEDSKEAELEIEYLVPAAAWRPAHRARLVDGTVHWEQGAYLWQRTGEDWRDVELVLSAERPSLGIEPPRVVDDVLSVQPKQATVVVTAREQEIADAGEGADTAAPPQPAVMGIDDGGLGLLLSPSGPCTVMSDGRPHRVALGSFQSEAEVDLLAIPLRSAQCHVRARFSNRGATPILPGPVDLVRRSGVVGRGEIGFLAPGERAVLGFASEPEVRAHREQREEQEEGSLLAGGMVKTIRVVIRLSNLGTSARSVLVQDRVPVSELEQVTVVVSPPDAFRLDKDKAKRRGEIVPPQIMARSIDEHGIVTWTVPLPPRGHAAVALEYRVKSARGVAGV